MISMLLPANNKYKCYWSFLALIYEIMGRFCKTSGDPFPPSWTSKHRYFDVMIFILPLLVPSVPEDAYRPPIALSFPNEAAKAVAVSWLGNFPNRHTWPIHDRDGWARGASARGFWSRPRVTPRRVHSSSHVEYMACCPPPLVPRHLRAGPNVSLSLSLPWLFRLGCHRLPPLGLNCALKHSAMALPPRAVTWDLDSPSGRAKSIPFPKRICFGISGGAGWIFGNGFLSLSVGFSILIEGWGTRNLIRFLCSCRRWLKLMWIPLDLDSLVMKGLVPSGSLFLVVLE